MTLLNDSEDKGTSFVLATVCKELWLATGNYEDLERAEREYLRCYSSPDPGYRAGIEAATLAYMKGDGQQARRLARDITSMCGDRLSTPEDDEYWLRATIGEASLLLDDLPGAERWYAEAARAGRDRIGDVISTWANARLILSLLAPEAYPRIERALDVPKVAVFAGHRIDAPERLQPRFPEHRVDAVKEEIRSKLLESRVRVGYSSAASGSDILFLEALQAVRAKSYVVLPCERAQFVQESVANAGSSWADRFDAVMRNATQVIFASNGRLKLGSVAYDFSSELLYGLAALRARQYGTNLVHVAVWDGREGDGRGGTADIVRRWKQRTNDLQIVEPTQPAGREGRLQNGQPEEDAGIPGFAAEIRAMLFADAYHFSNLSEEQVPIFVQRVMGAIGMLLRATHPSPLSQNTWGDGLFAVFATVRDAGSFALKLARRIAEIDRARWGLPRDLHLRISLHAGPVYRYKDQITDKMNYIGSHVNRAARIEPVTPPGQIYVTDAFAALAAVEVPGQFEFDYVGNVYLSKQAGASPIYLMRNVE
jgi:class 3 adenylate cyclase